jgi:very-short-patch-repair endonuclease
MPMLVRVRRPLLIAAVVIGIAAATLDLLRLTPGLGAQVAPLLIAVLGVFVLTDPAPRRQRSHYKTLSRQIEALSRRAPPAEPERAYRPQRAADDYRALAWHGLTLRSQSEVKIAKALDQRGLLFTAGVKVRLAAGDYHQTREVDFMVYHAGRWTALEVDGPQHERAAATDQQRDKSLHAAGLNVLRYPADRCSRAPEGVVEEFLAAVSLRDS